MSYVTIENIKKAFKGQTVLHDLNLSFKQGEFVTLLGPSGCGKSTLLRILAGLTSPEQGVIKIDGRDVTNVKAKDRQIGMVFQSYALFPNLTVSENIAFGLKMQKLPSKTIKQKVARMVALVGLAGKEDAYPRELSGGQQQRVALARSIVTEPKVLLLDEPLSALDAQIRKNLQKQLRTIQQELNITTVLVTHDQEEAMAVSDRIYILNEGRIAQSGTPHEIYTKPGSEFVARFIGNYNVLDGSELSIATSEKEFSNRLYAIRPEAFSAQFMEDGYAFSGRINKVMMLGNITRYEFSSNGIAVTAEHLHQSDEEVQEGARKTLYLHKKDVIPLS
ncbi:ABC transporter ATP-binding protein [Neobacillus sp. SAB-20_R2A]|uniref:ABC transporter ATP-binding protein n=1 Tax=Neobacillus sp. SAB-20_R2A TaxID=3120519 RepID=UPI003C6DDE7C